MKPKFTRRPAGLSVLMAILFMLAAIVGHAQLPDCTGGNVMYAAFTNIAGSTTADSTEIRPVDVTTGAIGNLVGGKRYWIRKQSGGGTYYYGVSALGADMITNRFYVMTQMSPAMQKDIVSIDPVNGTQVVIGTTPNGSGGTPNLNSYHFVKLAVAPNGWGYAIGVFRDSASGAANTFNPLIRFSTCGAVASAGCATIQLLGYLPSTPANMFKYQLFNGDIAFDVSGNLYFATAAFSTVNGFFRYTDARLFRINASDIPGASGTGTIPMTFVSEYDGLDSTVVNGIGLDANGNMFITTRRFNGPQTSPAGPSTPELWGSFAPGQLTQITGFAPIPANFSPSDLASCYFPTTILGLQKLQLQYKYENGNVNLKWEMVSNSPPLNFEVQRSDDGANFQTIATVPYGDQRSTYTYSDPQSGFGKNKYYRIRANMSSSMRNYTNVVSVNFSSKAHLLAELRPNPFNSYAQVDMWMKTAGTINVRILDQSGRMVYSRQFAGRAGENPLRLEGLGKLNAGIYVVEMRVQDEVMREKMIKQ
jgi:hypothetical protein